MRRTERLKQIVADRIRTIEPGLLALSHSIHATPELAYREHHALAVITRFLTEHGVRAEPGVYGIETAFRADIGPQPNKVAICAEYDALPEIGHACGHNIIAASAVGSAIGLDVVRDELPFGVLLLGTPAEEAGDAAGKVVMLDRGAFDGIAAAMMVHPAPFNVLRPMMIAAAQFQVEYSGRESHAAFYPELGVNAADALSIAQVALAFLRQSMLPTDRVHGIVTDGGKAPNIIPARSAGRFMVRTEHSDQLQQLLERVLACFEAGAKATGAELATTGGDMPYAHMSHNVKLVELFQANAEALGRRFNSDDGPGRPSGSTDMGNVSLRLPAIHPFIGVGSWPAVNHQPGFTTHCISSEADAAVMDGAIAMAWTTIDLIDVEDLDTYLVNV